MGVVSQAELAMTMINDKIMVTELSAAENPLKPNCNQAWAIWREYDMAGKTKTETTDPFANYQEFRPKAEDEKRSDYARALFPHARAQYPEDQVSDGALHQFLAPKAGYMGKSPHGAFYAALNPSSGNGTGKGSSPKTKDGLISKRDGLNEKIATLTADRDALNAKIETWDQDHAEDAAKKKKRKESTLNFLNSLTPEERQAFMESFNAGMTG
jgi:hypothetical protein